MSLYVFDADGYMSISLVYKANLYDEYTIKSLLEGIINVIHLVLENADMTINQLIPLDEDEYDHSGAEFEKYYES